MSYNVYCDYRECKCEECARHYIHADQDPKALFVMFNCSYIPFDNFEGYGKVSCAEWIMDEDGDGVHCSNCGKDYCTLIIEAEKFNFCPNCGAEIKKPVMTTDTRLDRAILATKICQLDDGCEGCPYQNPDGCSRKYYSEVLFMLQTLREMIDERRLSND